MDYGLNQQQHQKITETLLSDSSTFKDLRDGVHQLHRLLAAASGVTAGDINDEGIFLPSGMAISSIQAAHCLLEYKRTAKFLRGIYKAILQLKEDFPGERLHILYAGCGPYATLLTPLTTCFGSDELAFHLLDINAATLAAAKKLYNGFALNGYVAEWIQADATTYQVPVGQVMHLMISETMQNALQKEPQVEIMLNLVPQLPAKGLFIPKEITVSAQLLDRAMETRRVVKSGDMPVRINLGTIYTISRENCERPKEVTIIIPKEARKEQQLNLLTDIITFRDEKLGIYNCGLNAPFPLFDVDEHAGKRLKLQYRMGEVPGFEYNWVG